MVGMPGPGPPALPLWWGHLQQPSGNALQCSGLGLNLSVEPSECVMHVL